MREEKRGRFIQILLGLLALLWMAGAVALAQDLPPRLYITSTDVSSPPSIELRAYGTDATGAPLDLTQTALSIEHNNLPVGSGEPVGYHPAGTFTLFLIDIPTGVSDQLPAIRDAIIEYASTPTMVEQVDSVAIYQVGENNAIELLPPDTFYNGVRNLFATPMTPEAGATALVDSLMGLLEQVPALKPRADMVASLVVITDGTDVVSTQFEPEDVLVRAPQSEIPIHTIWLNNLDLTATSQERGRSYLADVAAATGGMTARLENVSDLPLIWDRIASFRDHIRVRYSVDGLSGGTVPVKLSLMGDAGVSSETTVTISGNTPTVAINMPLESRVLTLPDLEDPVEMRISTTITWLDGAERQLTAAQLVVNGMAPQSIPIERIDEFDIETTDLVFGDNTLQIAVLDEQGLRATSPVILLTVMEGPASIPDELQPSGGFWTIIGTIFIALVALTALAGTGFVAWRRRWFRRIRIPQLIPRGPSSRRARVQHAPPPIIRAQAGKAQDGDSPSPAVIAQLDVLESVSRMPSQIGLTRTQLRIGRSPAQSDIAFQDDITVSRLHASLMLEGDHYRIFDENSTSGTWVNEQQVPEYGIQLIDGDEIHLGAVHLRFRQP